MRQVRPPHVLRTIVLVAVVALVALSPFAETFGGALGASMGTSAAGATGAAPVQDGDAPADDAAILDLVGCLQGSHRLAVVFLIDESGSLQTTDPEARRVDAAKAAMSTLAGLAEGPAESRTTVDVTLAAFANRYRRVRDWTTLNAANEKRLEASLSTFADLDKGTDTDFVNALTGARRALADRSATVTGRDEPAPCKAVLFFTDGEYNIAVRNAKNVAELGRTKPYAPGIVLESKAAVAEAEAVGRGVLCDEGGLADGIRGDDITLLTVALAKELSAESQDFLSAVSTGSAGDVTCGRPTDTPTGTYLAADDVDVLIARFDEVAARVAGGTTVSSDEPVKICGADACPEGERSVNLDRSIRELRFLALAPKPGMVVEVEGPAGTVTIDKAGSSEVGEVKIRTKAVAGRGYAVELFRPAGDEAWTGTWKIRMLDPTGAQAGQEATLEIYLFSEIEVALTERPALIRGEDTKVSATLVVPKGVKVEDLIGTAEVSARFDDPVKRSSKSIALTGPPAGPYTGTFSTPADFRSSSYVVSVELRATTRDGATVVVRSAPTSVLVRRPVGSIQLSPASLEMPTLTGGGGTSADLTLIGGSKDGCVWFGPATSTAPKEAGALTVTYNGSQASSEATCIEVPANTTTTVTVGVRPARRATGAVRGVLEVHEKVAGAKGSVTDEPYRFDLAVGIDQTRRLLLAVLLVVGGLLLPMLLLVIINSFAARFQTLDAVRGAVVPVQVKGPQVLRADSARQLTLNLRASDFSSLRGAGSVRAFTFGGVEFRARASRNPFGVTAALAAPEGGAERLKGKAGSKVELDPSLSGSWIFLLDPDRTRRNEEGAAEGNLIAFIAEGDARPQLERLMPDISSRLPQTAADLADLVRTKQAKPPKPGRRGRGAEPPPTEASASEASEPVANGSDDVFEPSAPEPVSPGSDSSEPVETGPGA